MLIASKGELLADKSHDLHSGTEFVARTTSICCDFLCQGFKGLCLWCGAPWGWYARPELCHKKQAYTSAVLRSGMRVPILKRTESAKSQLSTHPRRTRSVASRWRTRLPACGLWSWPLWVSRALRSGWRSVDCAATQVTSVDAWRLALVGEFNRKKASPVGGGPGRVDQLADAPGFSSRVEGDTVFFPVKECFLRLPCSHGVACCLSMSFLPPIQYARR